MFETTDLNVRNARNQTLFRLLFGLMTGLLILPVLIILSMLTYKGGPALSIDFLWLSPIDGMTQGHPAGFLLAIGLVVVTAQADLQVRGANVKSQLGKKGRIEPAGFIKLGCAADLITDQFRAYHQFVNIECEGIFPTTGQGAGIENGVIVKVIEGFLLVAGF